jgi:hypothetical protein
MSRQQTTETKIWNSLRQHLPKKTHSQRIENRVSEGMPDCYLCIDGVPIWVELKIIKSNRIYLRPSQIAWHTSHSRCGGVSFFLCYSPTERLAFLFEGGLAAKIQGSGFDDLRPAALFYGDLKACALNLRPAACDLWSI